MKSIITTKYFGDIKFEGNIEFKCIDDDSGLHIPYVVTVQLNNQYININVSGWDYFGDKVKFCWEIIDKYLEINKIAKKAIVKSIFEEKGEANAYFKRKIWQIEHNKKFEMILVEHYGVNDFENIDIKKIIEKMYYPHLFFKKIGDNITHYLKYSIYGPLDSQYLNVYMNEKLDVIFIDEVW